MVTVLMGAKVRGSPMLVLCFWTQMCHDDGLDMTLWWWRLGDDRRMVATTQCNCGFGLFVVMVTT